MTTQVSNSMIAFDGGALGFRNRIINGNFSVNQRAVSGTVTLAAGAYGHDRWKAGAGGCTYTFATSNNVTTLTITAGTLVQVIEGANLLSGTHALSWAGTAQGRIDAGSYGASGLTGTAVGGTNQSIEFGTGTVSKVQYEAGSAATVFEFRPIGLETALCQRYYFKAVGVPLGVTLNITDGYASTLKFPTTMRIAPSLEAGAAYSVGTGSAGTPSLGATTADCALMRNGAGNWTANQSLSVTAGFTAEL